MINEMKNLFFFITTKLQLMKNYEELLFKLFAEYFFMCFYKCCIFKKCFKSVKKYNKHHK